MLECTQSLMPSFVTIQVENEKEGERIRDDLFDAGLNSVHDSFYREV